MKIIITLLLVLIGHFRCDAQIDTLHNAHPTINACEDTVFCGPIEKMPHFPGGDAALLRFTSEHFYYPKQCEEMVGRIIVSFVVETNGDLSNLHIIRNLGACFEPVILHVISSMPCWSPGEIDGAPVRCKMMLPIRVHLE